jgi:hypothetical protein
MTILGATSLCGIFASMTIEEATDGDIFLAYVEHILFSSRRALMPQCKTITFRPIPFAGFKMNTEALQCR